MRIYFLVPAALIVFIVLLALYQVHLRNSEQFQRAKVYIGEQAEIKNLIGEIEGYGILINAGDHPSDTLSFMTFNITGERGDVPVRVHFHKKAARWLPFQYEIVK
ncbi:MAG TPA: hypothetical protein VD816_05535 [Ohtaekwangia sp.]|nr:hypothetical protein [Ohtaekwangia sp.]